MDKKYLLYLRTDIATTEITSGGSVAHTQGVVQGFAAEGYSVIAASSAMQTLFKKMPVCEFIPLSNPLSLRFLRLKLNAFLSSFFFFFQLRNVCEKYPFVCIYQRYSVLNMTGVLLAWWYRKKLILEYNGSEAWIAVHWSSKKRFFSGAWLMYLVEWINIRRANLLVVVSEVLKEELEARGVGSEKILVNPNGVDPVMFSPAYKKGRDNEYA